MESPSPEQTPAIETAPEKKAETHEAGAWGAWGLIVGFFIGYLLGLLIDKSFLCGTLAAGIGWVVGAFIERAKK